MPVAVEWLDLDPDLTLPAFQTGRADMDFTLSDEQQAARDLAEQIFHDAGDRRAREGRGGDRRAVRP